jgi:cbb3-type cytochrome oxidase subunit 3
MGMKCVQCNTDNNLRDRTRNLGRCKQCNHPFVFEPTTVTDKKLQFTDPFFQKAIAVISSQNMLFFTPKQFLYFIDKRLKPRTSASGCLWIFFYLFLQFFVVIFGSMFTIIFLTFIFKSSNLGMAFLLVFTIYNLCYIWSFFRNSKSPEQSLRGRINNAKNLQFLGVMILLTGIPLSLMIHSFAGYMTVGLLGLSSYWLGISQKRRQHEIGEIFLINAAQSNEWLQRWQRVNGTLEKLLPSPRQEALSASIDPEVSAYSFDRAIICDSDEIAQFLIANNIHFENNCAILSINGYPQSIFDTVIQMLRRNADLKVYALHNANPAGVGLVHQLRTSPNWFANQAVTIFDLGISPRQILETRDMFVQQSQTMAQSARQLPDAVRQGLTAKELAWLDAGNFVELESFTPQKLLRVVNYGLAQSGAPQGNDGLILVDDNVGYGGGYVFVSDSFG